MLATVPDCDGVRRASSDEDAAEQRRSFFDSYQTLFGDGIVRAVRAPDHDDRPARARFNLLAGGLLVVIGVVLLVARWDAVAGVIFTFLGAVMLLASWLFSWSRKDRSSR
ncbi:hypothetical protein [Curtobacterium sp. ISL-83]|uniref:hypothetical protein n=1 Tax=Curtobacterium sp. ISL-83 TaxID=2819145 RepID=UPI001BE737DB|nr:hypothetical protein [Curtobacterium sp. ISL-83]MBT2503732.1 hypothetical protein [Curtobacterium sp. ISL-83]